jgi:DnaJ-class molecular chaperone
MKACKYCKGRGTYAVKETYGDGDEATMWFECGHCQGTGEDQGDQEEAGSVFNIDESEDEG